MGAVQLDWTLNVGQIITIGGALVAAMAFMARLLTQISLIGNRLSAVEEETKRQTDILITMAETKIRLDNMEKRSDERMSMINQRLIGLESNRFGAGQSP